MANNTEITEAEYLYKLVPDFSAFDLAEKTYWTKNSTYDSATADGTWYEIYKADATKTIVTDCYRGMFISYNDNLIFTGYNGLTYGVTVIKEKYDGRYVYVVSVDESGVLHSVITITGLNNGDFVTGVFF
jgi:hypothetical protein